MEGTWGRRVYGRVIRNKRYTHFVIDIETRERQKLGSSIILPNEDLDENPKLYGQVLDKMVERLDEAYNSTENMP